MAEVTEIHFLCRDKEGVARETAESFESAAWDIAARHLRPGVLFALHQHRELRSYLQGKIRSYAPADNGRFIVTVQKSLASMPWRGSGTGEVGFYWGAGDWSHLPQVPITIRDLKPGKNHALRNLNEADPSDFRYRRERTFLAKGQANGNRQATFKNWLLRIALSLDGRKVPYAFCDAASRPFRLDHGAIGITIRQGMVDEPLADPDGRVHGYLSTTAIGGVKKRAVTLPYCGRRTATRMMWTETSSMNSIPLS